MSVGNRSDLSRSNLETIDLSLVKLDPSWSHVLPASGARRFRSLALCQVEDEVIVATGHSNLAEVDKFVCSQIDSPYRIVLAEITAIRRLLQQVYPQQTKVDNSASDLGEAVQACDGLFNAALLREASDIHLVPGESELQSHFRVDGILENYRRFPVEIQSGLVSRIKVLAGLNIAEKRKPQDGRFTLKAGVRNRSTDVRVATIPTRFGERVTLRLLTPLEGTSSLADLGMESADLEVFESTIGNSNGLVLLTGPTGCGKSTTLYTAIRQLLQTRGGNVITVEDPIEFEIPGTSQVEVDASEKISFATALRSILRHDPDVIMLGEIRDAETAELAIKASLTGHLVFSTLHTNTAAGVVTRLIDMGVEPFLIAATLRLAVAQRLVRKLCSKCHQKGSVSSTDAAVLGKSELQGTDSYEPTGCVYCAGKGYVGRVALFEMLRGGVNVSDLISNGATESELLEHMRHEGHRRLIDDGMDKIHSGTTTAEQVLRAVAAW